MRQVVEKKTEDLKIFAKKSLLQVKEGWRLLHCPLLYNLCILSWAFWAFTFEFFPGNCWIRWEVLHLRPILNSHLFCDFPISSAKSNRKRGDGIWGENVNSGNIFFCPVSNLRAPKTFYSKYSLICDARPNKLDLGKYNPDFRWDIKNEVTLSKAQRTRGLSSYHKFLRKSWSNFNFRISIKH